MGRSMPSVQKRLRERKKMQKRIAKREKAKQRRMLKNGVLLDEDGNPIEVADGAEVPEGAQEAADEGPEIVDLEDMWQDAGDDLVADEDDSGKN